MDAHQRRCATATSVTILLTTHYLDEADALCDRILIIDAGKIVAAGTPDRAQAPDLRRPRHVRASTTSRARPSCSKTHAEARDVTAVDGGLRVTVDDGEAQALPLMRALDAAGIKVGALAIRHPSLDDVFLTLTGRSLRDAPSA